MQILYKGSVIAQSLLPLSVGDEWVYGGQTYTVIATDNYGAPTAIVTKKEN